MEKLLTLKDLTPFKPKKTESLMDLVNSKDLKAEAIKWIRVMEKRGKKKYKEEYKQQFLFMYFFNITSEDLK